MIDLNNFSLWEDRDKIRLFSSISGFLLSFSWLIFFYEYYNNNNSEGNEYPPKLFLPGIAASLSFFNFIFLDLGVILREEAAVSENPQSLYEMRFIAFISMGLVIAAFVGSMVYSSDDTLNDGNLPTVSAVQVVLICFSGILIKAAQTYVD